MVVAAEQGTTEGLLRVLRHEVSEGVLPCQCCHET